ncbi:MAG TPA: bifunctional UDP-N-acetylmuramoyl-tripeptide:D-alanyl-D-alanine ligase/alanine racemase, partial [Chitinophagaceae bacterium]|nr:bifunctional UDP-N-acetylmuramoyl-tripeptide:D-alanyl-D-alanine ligase/alanine racemase [Chitinophagaceae bacterium]
ENLEKIIQPTIGVLTNIGQAHSEGFNSFTEKALEKAKLFKHCQHIIYPKNNAAQLDPENEDKALFNEDAKFYSWSKLDKAWLQITSIEKKAAYTIIKAQNNNREILIQIPFTDDASIENAITCWCVLLVMAIKQGTISAGMKTLSSVNMRLELKKGINQCTVINDRYSADLSSLVIALDFLEQQSAGAKKTVIVSDFLQAGMNEENLYEMIAHLLKQHHIDRLIAIGESVSHHLAVMLQDSSIQQDYFLRTESFLEHFRLSQFKEETILVKGARVFEFEKIVRLLEYKVHQTVLEINLNAFAHNLKQYQQLLKPSVKIMAMVKAFAYGSGGAEIAGILQYHKVDYLGVAYADEGVELRNAGITLPVMVMNPEENSFFAIIENNLEPEIYSFELLQSFDAFLQREALESYPIHIEIETGMNRLGFATEDIDKLATTLLRTNSFKVQSVFSHLAASEDSNLDTFTKKQFELFQQSSGELQNKVGYSFLRHIANSAAIVRHPEMHLDLVRPGIGLYGINSIEGNQLNLQTVATLKATIAQLKYLKKGESVSYNRSGMVNQDSVIATVRIGYADGYPRRLGNGAGKMIIKGKLAPVLGNVCMDMTMIDVSSFPEIKEGDEVIIFGKELPVQRLAQWAETIPYEIMTGISQRVKRVYYEE